MTEEEIQALQDAKDAAERRAAEAETAAQAARAEADKAKSDITNVVEELKTERQKKNEALSKANINNNEPVDVNSLIESALRSKEEERRKAEIEQAIAEFKQSKPEFQADSAGLVFGKFKEKLNMFNLSDLSTKEQVKSRLEDVYRFANLNSVDGSSNDYTGSPQNSYNVPEKTNKPSKEVEAAVNMARMTPERFSKLKSKYPDALGNLGIE